MSIGVANEEPGTGNSNGSVLTDAVFAGKAFANGALTDEAFGNEVFAEDALDD